MGGYHVSWRKTNEATARYTALNSYFRVPTTIKADAATTSYPEFIYNLKSQDNNYNVDIGFGYGFPGHAGRWILFGSGSSVIDKNLEGWEQTPTSFVLTPGDIILFAVYFTTKNGEPYIRATLTQENQTSPFVSHDFHIKSNAYTTMSKGCHFERESLLASNAAPSQYINSNGARFQFAKWYRGTLTRNDGAYVPFVGKVFPPSKDTDNGFTTLTKQEACDHICTYCINESWPGDTAGNGFGCECASASFASIKSLTGDFPCSQSCN